MSTRRQFLKGSAAFAAIGLVAPKVSDPPLEIDWHETGLDNGMIYVHAHASWPTDPMKGPKEWAGGMTVVDNPEAIGWAKERLGSMLLHAYGRA